MPQHPQHVMKPLTAPRFWTAQSYVVCAASTIGESSVCHRTTRRGAVFSLF
jgi:hypothetical protein